MTTGECGLTRYAPSLVRSVRSLVQEKASNRPPRHPGRSSHAPDATRHHGDRHLRSGRTCQKSHTKQGSVLLRLPSVRSDILQRSAARTRQMVRQYSDFSSSLTLTNRGAASPARHVLNRSRPTQLPNTAQKNDAGTHTAETSNNREWMTMARTPCYKSIKEDFPSHDREPAAKDRCGPAVRTSGICLHFP
jgi:hypothetical protein